MPPRARKVDDNQKSIRLHLEAHGCYVQDCSRMGEGFPDLLVGYDGHWYAMEIKNPDGRNKFTPAQIEWLVRLGNRAKAYRVTTEQEAWNIINLGAQNGG
jgi:hypothetical protein